MRRIATLALLLALSGCGSATWSDLPFTPGPNRHLPVDPSETMTRAMGGTPTVAPLLPEPGDIWPSKMPAEPTLQDMEADQQNGTSPPTAPVGSAGYVAPPLPPLPKLASPSAGASASAPAPGATGAAATGSVSGQVYQTPQGPVVTSGGTGGYQTATTPGGGQAIIVPNGNGTSTIIHADGTLETVPTPKQ
ncbi:MAG: hypothetical protein KGL12_11815 [Rhodospirillales bacterium]|nr:hypothetical protein [Rhodospirillales bacterium]